MRDEDSLMYPPLDKLLDKIPDKYALVLTATKRAKQIILQNRLNPVAAEDSEVQRKPLSIALHDIVDGVVDQSALQAPDVFLDDYVEEEPPAYPEIDMPGDELAAAEPEVAAEPEPAEDDFDDLSDVEDVLDIELFSEDQEDKKDKAD